MEINENQVYTPKEAQKLLKVSPSTLSRLIKKGLIRAAKVGKQYRIMGKEILRMVSPELEDKVGILYNKGRRWIHSYDSPASKDAGAAPQSDPHTQPGGPA
ncbi:MAG: helix-turn-helix domain-containing protein [Candidatus Omnitrophica bacterium]|nr:helix-turn-helix domain-containing protein [Candidatus Omnitrophota bacterium]